MEDEITIADVWAWLNHGFEAAMIDSELIPDHFRRQYGKGVSRLRRQIAKDMKITSDLVDTLPPRTTIEVEAICFFNNLKQLRAKLIADHIEKYV